MLAGLGFMLMPSGPAAAASPAQGWTTTQAPLPTDAGNGSTDPRAYVSSATCPAANGCMNVGWYEDTGGHTWGLIEQQNGTSWTDTEAPQPSDAGSGSDQGLWIGSENCGFARPCRAISCPTTTFCVAAGNYLDTSGRSEPLIETWSGGTWTATKAALPSNAASDAGPNFPNDYTFSVSCASATSCVAVGQYTTTAGVFLPLIDTLSGSSWSAVSPSLPSDAEDGVLLGVSCAATTVCTAGGTYQDNSGGGGSRTHAIVANLANGAWTALVAPEPPNAGDDAHSNQSAQVVQVVCPSATACTGVGEYQTSSSGTAGLIESYNGSSWSAQAGPTPSATNFSLLNTVSCPTPTWCVASGGYNDSSGHEWGLIDTLSAGAWTGIQAPQPSNAAPGSGQSAELIEVSCPTPAFCMTVGGYRIPGSPNTISAGYTDTLSSGAWSTVETPVPSNATVNNVTDTLSNTRTVACYSPVACAVGSPFNDQANHTQVALDTWTGAQGYWLDATDGGIFTYPNNGFFGSTGSLKLNKPMVGMAASPDGQGYWLVASDGGIFSYGDALFHGSRGGQPLNAPIVGMATTPTGNGYWLVASDGGIFAYGDAAFFGSRGGQPLNKPIVGMAATPDGMGYWLVASDGGIFSYGDANFYGSTGSIALNKPVVGMASSPTGLGYWLVASDGGIFNYGDGNFYGSTGSLVLNKPVVGMAASPSGKGYWLAASDGGIFNYGDAPFQGSAGSLHLNAPVVGMAGG